jgi:hypothetical protein
MNNPVVWLFDNYMLLGFIMCFIMMGRVALIVSGRLKGPVLRNFERYGDDETYYQPLTWLLVWFCLSLYFLNYLIGFVFCMEPLVVAVLYMAYVLLNHPQTIKKHDWLFLRYPLWLADLRDRTSRLERRRIAYMWLRLPRRTRFAYNSNDRAFLEWADFIILGTFR